jgi:anti-sigma regulatory factor (Ser/Thr protein kinase)
LSKPPQPATIEGLTIAVDRLRRGVVALKAENHQLRAELAKASSRPGDDPAVQAAGELAEIALPTGPRAPGAARMVIAHCITRLVAPRALDVATLLGSELVTNSVRHGQLAEHDTVLLRIQLTLDALRLEVQNTGTAGTVAARQPDRQDGGGGFGLVLVDLLATRWGVHRRHGTTVWCEVGRA